MPNICICIGRPNTQKSDRLGEQTLWGLFTRGYATYKLVLGVNQLPQLTPHQLSLLACSVTLASDSGVGLCLHAISHLEHARVVFAYTLYARITDDM